MVDIITFNGIKSLRSSGLHSIRLVVKGYLSKFLLGEVNYRSPQRISEWILRLIRYSFKLYFCVAKRVGSFMPVMNDFTGKFQKISWGETLERVIRGANSKTTRTAR